MEIRRHDKIMKILVLNYEFPPLGGGAGNATANISKELVRQGHRVTVVTTWFKGMPERQSLDGYSVIRVHSRRARADRSNIFEMFHYVILSARASARMLRDEPHNCVISFFALPTGLVAWHLNKKFGIPYVLSLRGGDVPGFLPNNLSRYHALTTPFTRLVWRRAKRIVANSEGLKALAEKTAKKLGKEVIMIPNGVDTDIFRPDDAPENTPSILFAARLTEQKGATFLLKALAEMKAREPGIFAGVRCSIVGDGPLRQSLEKEARELGIAERVEFRGWIERSVLSREYRRHSIFVLPTFEEGMPNALLEAMASGLAIVATDVPGNNELIRNGESGILIKSSKNPSGDLAQALIELCRHREMIEKCGRAARAEAERRGWGEIARRYANLCA